MHSRITVNACNVVNNPYSKTPLYIEQEITVKVLRIGTLADINFYLEVLSNRNFETKVYIERCRAP